MECIVSASYSILINGEPNGFINPTRGIRQGDPLSPYIFILCMEALSHSLITASLRPKSRIGIKICPRMNKIPYLLFANDCLMLCKVDQSNSQNLKNLLDNFCSISEQLINYHKSILIFSINATSTHRQMVAGIFNITHIKSLGKYLGCLVFQNKPSRKLLTKQW